MKAPIGAQMNTNFDILTLSTALVHMDTSKELYKNA